MGYGDRVDFLSPHPTVLSPTKRTKLVFEVLAFMFHFAQGFGSARYSSVPGDYNRFRNTDQSLSLFCFLLVLLVDFGQGKLDERGRASGAVTAENDL